MIPQILHILSIGDTGPYHTLPGSRKNQDNNQRDPYNICYHEPRFKMDGLRNEPVVAPLSPSQYTPHVGTLLGTTDRGSVTTSSRQRVRRRHVPTSLSMKLNLSDHVKRPRTTQNHVISYDVFLCLSYSRQMIARPDTELANLLVKLRAQSTTNAVAQCTVHLTRCYDRPTDQRAVYRHFLILFHCFSVPYEIKITYQLLPTIEYSLSHNTVDGSESNIAF